MNLTGAKSRQAIGAREPELVLIGVVPKGDPRDDGFDIKRRILAEAVFEKVPHDSSRPVYVGHLEDLYDVRAFSPDRKGPYTLHTTDGDLKYGGFSWVSLSDKALPIPLVSVYVQARWAGDGMRESGNLQYLYVPVAVVEKLLIENNLDKEFKVADGRMVFCGDKEAIRSFRIYPHYNDLTWMVHYEFRPNEVADKQDEWAGAYFPDEETVKRAGDQWVKFGSKTHCSGLRALKTLFPGHPVIPKVEEFEENERRNS